MPDPSAASELSKKYDEVVSLYKKNYLKGRSMIHVVAKLGRSDLLDAAMDMDYRTGALLNLRTDANGWTALHMAAQEGEDSSIKTLLKREGININAKTSSWGQTALYVAAVAGKISTVKLLLEYKIDIDSKDNVGKTALHGAARDGYVDIVKLLLKKGAKIEAKMKDGETPLHLAAYYGREAVVKCLLSNDADVSVKVTEGSNKGLTPRELAIQKKHKGVVELLKK